GNRGVQAPGFGQGLRREPGRGPREDHCRRHRTPGCRRRRQRFGDAGSCDRTDSVSPEKSLDAQELPQVIETPSPLTPDTRAPRSRPPVVAGLVRPTGCPFHDGATTIDLLLAEVDPRDTALFDAALDLRSL